LDESLPKALLSRRGWRSILNNNLDFPNNVGFKWTFSPISTSHNVDVEYILSFDLRDISNFEIVRETLQETRPRPGHERRGVNWKYLDFAFKKGVVNKYEDNTPVGFEPKLIDEALREGELALKMISSPKSYPALHDIASELSKWRFYNSNNISIRSIQDNPAEIGIEEYYLDETGENLAILLYHLISRAESGFEDELSSILRAMFDDFDGLRFPIVDASHLELLWKSKKFKKPLKLFQLSDGTIRMLCWIAALIHPDPSPLICIDEPEFGLHPAWLSIIADLIKSASKKKQILIATHSPDLLNCFDKEAKNIIVTETNDAGITVFKKLDIDELNHWLTKYNLGELYRNRELVVGGWPY
jgi:predicted ATPase